MIGPHICFSINTYSTYLIYDIISYIVVFSINHLSRLLNGDYEGSCLEFVNVVEVLAGKDGCLGGREFDLADTAVETAASKVNLHPEISISPGIFQSCTVYSILFIIIPVSNLKKNLS